MFLCGNIFLSIVPFVLLSYTCMVIIALFVLLSDTFCWSLESSFEDIDTNMLFNSLRPSDAYMRQ